MVDRAESNDRVRAGGRIRRGPRPVPPGMREVFAERIAASSPVTSLKEIDGLIIKAVTLLNERRVRADAMAVRRLIYGFKGGRSDYDLTHGWLNHRMKFLADAGKLVAERDIRRSMNSGRDIVRIFYHPAAGN